MAPCRRRHEFSRPYGLPLPSDVTNVNDVREDTSLDHINVVVPQDQHSSCTQVHSYMGAGLGSYGVAHQIAGYGVDSTLETPHESIDVQQAMEMGVFPFRYMEDDLGLIGGSNITNTDNAMTGSSANLRSLHNQCETMFVDPNPHSSLQPYAAPPLYATNDFQPSNAASFNQLSDLVISQAPGVDQLSGPIAVTASQQPTMNFVSNQTYGDRSFNDLTLSPDQLARQQINQFSNWMFPSTYDPTNGKSSGSQLSQALPLNGMNINSSASLVNSCLPNVPQQHFSYVPLPNHMDLCMDHPMNLEPPLGSFLSFEPITMSGLQFPPQTMQTGNICSPIDLVPNQQDNIAPGRLNMSTPMTMSFPALESVPIYQGIPMVNTTPHECAPNASNRGLFDHALQQAHAKPNRLQSTELPTGEDNRPSGGRRMKAGKAQAGRVKRSTTDAKLRKIVPQRQSHNWSEQQRRKSMNQDYSTMRAMLPHQPAKADKCTLILDFIDYIHRMEAELDKITRRHKQMVAARPNNLVPSQRAHALTCVDHTADASALTAVTTLPQPGSSESTLASFMGTNVAVVVSGTNILVTVSAHPGRHGLLSDLIVVLECHNIAVLSCCVNATDNTAVYCLHCEASWHAMALGEELHVALQRVVNNFHGASSSNANA